MDSVGDDFEQQRSVHEGPAPNFPQRQAVTPLFSAQIPYVALHRVPRRHLVTAHLPGHGRGDDANFFPDGPGHFQLVQYGRYQRLQRLIFRYHRPAWLLQHQLGRRIAPGLAVRRVRL